MIDSVSRVVARMQAIEAMGRPSTPPPAVQTPPEATFAHVLQRLVTESAPMTPLSGAYPAFPAGQVGAPAGAAFVPPELAAHGNGRIPPEALVPIGQGEHRLWGPAAISFRAMATEAAAAGISLPVTDSYRSLERQYTMADQFGLYREGGLAAVPGTSDHGWGLAVDIELTPAAQQWMQANGPRFGFVADVPREPWHWTYRGNARA